MAAEAFDSGDYRSAAQLFARARELAEKDEDDNAWMETTLLLARAKLRSGDIDGAKKLLAEFSKRFPAHSYGLLPGEILAAEGKIPEAESFFRSVQNSNAEPAVRASAELALAYLQLRSGSAALALEELTKLEADPALRREARPLRIYAFIKAGRPEEAKRLAAESAKGFTPPLPAARLALLGQLAELKNGRGAEFVRVWEQLRPGIKPHPDELVFETLDTAARLALTEKLPDRAALYWHDAYGFASGDDERRDILRKLFNCYSAFDVRKAADTARRYVSYFPGAMDRAQLLNGAGQLLAASGDHKAALEFFASVVSDGELLPAERRDAARDAALAAEAAGDHRTARRYFNYLVSSADSTATQHRALIFYAEYLIRKKDWAAAEKVLHRVTGSAVRELSDRAGKLLIQTLVEQKKYAPALTTAENLKNSADPESAEFGEFHCAYLAEKLGRSEAARKLYLDFADRRKNSAFVREARFAAALLALRAGNTKAAAREFTDFAAAYPGNFAANALFWAVRAHCISGDAAGAESAFSALAKGSGPGREYYAAALQLCEFLRTDRQPERGLKLLDALDKSKCDDREKAALSLERALLLAECRRGDEAIQEAEELLKSFSSDSSVAADAAFLAGNLLLDRGRSKAALEMFVRARELRPSGLFGAVAAGRIGDAMLARYSSTQEPEHLKKAEEVFRKLSRDSDFPAVRLQSLFKLGCCLEYLGRDRWPDALDAYYQALLFAQTLGRRGIPFESTWCSRSAHSALRLLLNSRLPGRFQRGARIIDAYRKLGIPDADAEYDELEKEFKEQYLKREM